MATIKYLIQSEKDNANVYVRYSIDRKTNLKRKTGFTINPKDWSGDRGFPKQGRDDLKVLKSKLDKLAIFINDAYNVDVNKGVVFTGEWLQYKINLFNNKIIVVDLDVLTNSVDEYLNKKQELTKGSKKNLENLKKVIVRYESYVLKNRNVLIRDVGLDLINNFTNYLRSNGCSDNYIGTYISLMKVVINHAITNEIPAHPQFSKIATLKKYRELDEIITLSEVEQFQIKNAELIKPAHINARKWLLLGCLVGQRAGDLLNITDKNIRDSGSLKIIELKQQKTGKLVVIPLMPEAIEIIESGMPYKTNLEHFNSYIKDVCQIAKINTIVKGKMRIDKKRTLTSGNYEKWQIMSSHVCRRSFATNFYGKIPTAFLMNITGHGTESMFLKYIGKTTYDNAHQFMEHFNKLS